MAEKVVIKKKGKKPIVFEKGGLHRSLGIPEDEKIPKEKLEWALKQEGTKVQKQARLAVGALAAGRKTAQKNRRKRR